VNLPSPDATAVNNNHLREIGDELMVRRIIEALGADPASYRSI
jgi:hypothetical protein